MSIWFDDKPVAVELTSRQAARIWMELEHRGSHWYDSTEGIARMDRIVRLSICFILGLCFGVILSVLAHK